MDWFLYDNGLCHERVNHDWRNLLSWQLKWLKRKLKNFLAAEAIAMLDGLEVTLYISELLKETYKNYKIPIEVYTDNFTMRYNALLCVTLLRVTI